MGFQPLNKPDKKLAHDQLQALQALLKAWGNEAFCRAMLWIAVKVPTLSGEEESRIVPFGWNAIQRHLHANEERNNRILKGRQAGFTTYELLDRLFLPVATEAGKTGMLVAQNHKYAADIFAIAHRAYRLFGAVDHRNDELNETCLSLKRNLLHTVYSNRKELVFDILDSRLIIESAEVEEAGQGLCVSPDTWVMDGRFRIKRYRELKRGDVVPDEAGRPVRVKKMYTIRAADHPYQGEAVTVVVRGSRTLPMTVAPNHPFLTQRGMTEARHITAADYIAYPKRKLKTSLREIDLRKYEIVSASGRRYKARGRRRILLDREFGLLCGFYLADGSLRDRVIAFTMANPRKVRDVLPRLSALSRRYEWGMKQFPGTDDKRPWCTINNVQLMRFMEKWFGRSRRKHIPAWWHKCPKEFLRGLLEGWIHGDGCFLHRCVEASGKNARVVLGMRELSVALGIGMPYLRITDKPDSRIVIQGIECNNVGRSYRLFWYNEAFDGLQKLFPWIEHIGMVQGRKSSQYQTADYVYVRVHSVTQARVEMFMDLTVDSGTHLYCLPNGVTHNTIHHLVCSEAPRWPGDPEATMSNLLGALVPGGTRDEEGTANGAAGYFYERYIASMNLAPDKRDCKPHWYAWWNSDDYRMELTPKQARELAADLTEDEARIVSRIQAGMDDVSWLPASARAA